LDPQHLKQVVAAHRPQHAQRLAEYRRILSEIQDSEPLPAWTVRYGIAYEEAALRWFDEFIASLSEASPGTGITGAGARAPGPARSQKSLFASAPGGAPPPPSRSTMPPLYRLIASTTQRPAIAASA